MPAHYDKNFTWDVSAFYCLAVDRRIRSIRLGVRWRRFACGSSADRIFDRVIDNNKCGQRCDSDLDFQQRNILQRRRGMERYRGDERDAKHRLTQ
jgi:hypothetical protein